MRQAAVSLSVLVADIADQNALLRRLKNERAQIFLRDLLEDLSGVARINNGELHHTVNGGLMCAFMSASDALIAAATMHQIMQGRPLVSWADLDALGLRIRVDTGTVLREGNRLLGDAVQSAIEMKSLAKPYQTLISETTRTYLTSAQKCQTRFVGSLPTKDYGVYLNVFEYLGKKEEDTLAVEFPTETPPVYALDISCGPRVFTVDARQPSVTIGRLTTNNLVLNYPRVSRQHAKIEHRAGKLILVDESANGTFVRIGELDMLFLKNDEMQLYGKGLICPGREASSSSPGAIHFAAR